jgi:hypothetical protein
MKEFTASHDSTAMLVTISVALVLVLLCFLFFKNKSVRAKLPFVVRLLLIMVMILGVGWAFMCHPSGYAFTSNKLLIKRPKGDIQIYVKDILDCHRLTSADMQNTSKVAGIGGLFGYFGDYHNAAIGDMVMYATNRNNLVLFHTAKGEAIVISPDKPDDFVKEVMDRITPNN